jgi:hypothetical protein
MIRPLIGWNGPAQELNSASRLDEGGEHEESHAPACGYPITPRHQREQHEQKGADHRSLACWSRFAA